MPLASQEKIVPVFWLRVMISFISVGVILGRMLFPSVKIDSITLGLLIVAILPWLSSLIESAEFPGGWKIKFRDIRKAVETANTIDFETSSLNRKEPLSYLNVFEQDPNLGLVALRIEIEKRVRELAKKYNIEEQQSLRRILNALMQKDVLESSTISGLNDLIAVGNRAAHGAKVEPDVATWAANASGKFLYFLDRKINELI